MEIELTWSSFSGFLRPIKAFTHFPEPPIDLNLLIETNLELRILSKNFSFQLIEPQTAKLTEKEEM